MWCDDLAKEGTKRIQSCKKLSQREVKGGKGSLVKWWARHGCGIGGGLSLLNLHCAKVCGGALRQSDAFLITLTISQDYSL